MINKIKKINKMNNLKEVMNLQIYKFNAKKKKR